MNNENVRKLVEAWQQKDWGVRNPDEVAAICAGQLQRALEATPPAQDTPTAVDEEPLGLQYHLDTTQDAAPINPQPIDSKTIAVQDTPPRGGGEAGKLWALHIEGPDDVAPAPSRELAQQATDLFNSTFPQSDDPNWPRAVAKIIEWPHGAPSHALEAPSFVDNWIKPTTIRASAALPPAQPHDTGTEGGEAVTLQGWTIKRDADGGMRVFNEQIGGMVVYPERERLADRLLFALASSIFARKRWDAARATQASEGADIPTELRKTLAEAKRHSPSTAGRGAIRRFQELAGDYVQRLIEESDAARATQEPGR